MELKEFITETLVQIQEAQDAKARCARSGAAGVVDRVWDMNDVVALIAAQEDSIAKRAL